MSSIAVLQTESLVVKKNLKPEQKRIYGKMF